MLHINVGTNKKGRGEMIKAPIHLQDLRRRLYVKAKTEPSWRFWGLYVHVCKPETLREAYRLAKAKDGRERDNILRKIHAISPFWKEPQPAKK